MNNYIENKKKQLEQEKNQYMEEAWENFKKREKLPLSTDRLYFELNTKTQNIGDRWGAYKHTYTSAAFTKKYGRIKAKLLGDTNELIQLGVIKSIPSDKKYSPGNEPQDRRMDLKNNAVGRKIAERNSGLNLLDEVYHALDHDPDIVLNQYINNDKPYNDTPVMNAVWKLADKGYENKDKVNNVLKGGIEYVKNITNTPKSLKEKLLRLREEKLAKYTQRLAETPEKKAELEAKHTSLKDLKKPQQNRVNRVHDMIANHEEKLKEKKYKKKSSYSKNSTSSGSGGRWITVRGRHIFVSD